MYRKMRVGQKYEKAFNQIQKLLLHQYLQSSVQNILRRFRLHNSCIDNKIFCM